MFYISTIVSILVWKSSKITACYTYNCWNIITVMNIHCIVFAVPVILCVKDSQEIILPHWVADTNVFIFLFLWYAWVLVVNISLQRNSGIWLRQIYINTYYTRLLCPNCFENSYSSCRYWMKYMVTQLIVCVRTVVEHVLTGLCYICALWYAASVLASTDNTGHSESNLSGWISKYGHYHL